MADYLSWGRTFRFSQDAVRLFEPWRVELPVTARSVLPYGMGRSYGDSCLNEGGMLLVTPGMNRFVSFDDQAGVLVCEAGVTLAEILRLTVDRGWFLPVSPGTKFVTVGGAIANDVHGKNHHRAGTFGCSVRGFELLRSTGERVWCSREQNSALFSATIGGIGLTGLVLKAELQLRKVSGPFIDCESLQFESFDEFLALSRESDQTFEYTAAWLDCSLRGEERIRGLFLRGNHAEQPGRYRTPWMVPVPCDAPGWLLNRFTIGAFNALYYRKQLRRAVRKRVPFDPFFYPLDAVANWNRIYGKRGLFQFQCVVPSDGDCRAVRELLRVVVRSGRASFLAVLKEFGAQESPGMLSFPRRGVTLCLDFPNDGERTLRLLKELEGITQSGGGAMYPAKDALMSAESYRAFYPRLDEFRQYVDPKFSSSFWRRVTGG